MSYEIIKAQVKETYTLTEVINTNGVITFIGNLPRRSSGTFTIINGKTTGLFNHNPPQYSFSN